LANAAVIHHRRPTTLTTSQRVAEWLRPLLKKHGAIAGERTLRVLACTKPTADQAGRWATSADLSALAAYERQIEAEQRKQIDTSWAGLVARKELAIAVADDGIVATIRRYGRAPSSAGIADLYVLPRARRSHVGSHLAGFVAHDLLSHRKTVYAAIDDSDAPGLALHAAVGFVPAGACYRALLK
jgi:GNAT superfamily N-acetyltransferase